MNVARSATSAFAVAALAISAVTVVGTAPVGADDGSRAGVCAGVKRCHRVARIDVNGDRRADRVGWVQISRKRVRIRVRITGGRVVSRRVNVRLWWGGGVWGGGAWIDGRRGAELLVGSAMGAHTPFYTMLTYRRGDLVVEKSPATGAYGGDRWAIDASLVASAGWKRHAGRRGRVTMTQRTATRNGDGPRYSGRNVRYAWRHGDWKRVNRTPRTYKNGRRAHRIAGWQVGHLERFPGI